MCETDFIRLLSEMGDPRGMSFDQICSAIGKPESTVVGDPLRCLTDSTACAWKAGCRTVTMYFDTEEICFGADFDRILLPRETDIRSEDVLSELLGIFK